MSKTNNINHTAKHMSIQYNKGDVKIMKLIFSIPNNDEKLQ